MLRIALIPSVALMIVGIGLSGYLALQGLSTRTFAENVRKSLEPSTHFIATVQEERRLSTLKVVNGLKPADGLLANQRTKVDEAVQEMTDVTEELAETAPDQLAGPLGDLKNLTAELPGFRQRIDSGGADAEQVYEFYGEMIELIGAGIQGVARSASDAEVGFEQMISYDLFRSVEAQSRSHALLLRGIAQGLDLDEFHELAHQMGTYHEIAETMYPRMTPTEQQRYDEMKEAPWWGTVVSGDNSIMARGPGQHPVTFNFEAWQNSAAKLSDGLRELYASHSAHAAELGAGSGNRLLTSSLAAGGLLLLVTATSMVIALRWSRKLARRLTRLRDDTLDLSRYKLPDVVDRLNHGERVDLDSDVPWLNHGDDEIGQVADAFNQAQRQAISATVQENEIRAGVRAVFLNIAHRNQVTAHRQLQVLDQAERSQEDPEQLQLLFELDHLATQGRRNAESLIILGGKQPGRQWRKPVELRDVINGAVAETAQYTKVNVSKVADVAVRGDAVADMIHLLAELLDNATSFSPPQTDVDVRSAVVGRGVVIEIEDQGLGIDAETLEEINAMLRTPPDFSVMSLSEEARIGLFVVAQLAAKHDTKVTLRESLYGGINAIVLIPTKALASESMPQHGAPEDASADFGHDFNADPTAGAGIEPGYGRGPRHMAEPGYAPGASNGYDSGYASVPGADHDDVNTNDRVVPMPPPTHRRARQARTPERRFEDTQKNIPAVPPAPPSTDGADRANGQSGGAMSHGGQHAGRSGGGNDTVKISMDSSVISNGSSSQAEQYTPPRPTPSAGNGNGKPPLPQRRRRESLAPQLHADEESAESEQSTTPEPPDEPPGDPSPERFQATMSAFQRGTRRARTDDTDTPHPPRWPGGEMS
ncbi:sensor histidine kinase [Haloechinothrix halophila]|uniref:sensor histidine kinase n=1 Tax=Haloechinothrix halophila TaxID=1069073 RepID=UPI000403FF65|nr:nitrate- and nitrite sensing domain-containing protein [Haloechinothrix halophila]